MSYAEWVLFFLPSLFSLSLSHSFLSTCHRIDVSGTAAQIVIAVPRVHRHRAWWPSRGRFSNTFRPSTLHSSRGQRARRFARCAPAGRPTRCIEFSEPDLTLAISMLMRDHANATRGPARGAIGHSLPQAGPPNSPEGTYSRAASPRSARATSSR